MRSLSTPAVEEIDKILAMIPTLLFCFNRGTNGISKDSDPRKWVEGHHLGC